MAPGITVRIIKTFVFSDNGMDDLSIAQDKIYFIPDFPKGRSTGNDVSSIDDAESIPVIGFATLDPKFILPCPAGCDHVPAHVGIHVAQPFWQSDGLAGTIGILVF